MERGPATGPDRLRVRPSALGVIREHAGAARPEECCGALVGRADGVIVRAAPLPNEARWRRGRYEIGPAWVRRAEAEAAAEGLDVIGFYHSHPHRVATPSLLDIECAWPWYVYLIEGADGARAWRLREDRVGFEEVVLEPGEAAGGAARPGEWA